MPKSFSPEARSSSANILMNLEESHLQAAKVLSKCTPEAMYP
jgi:hypothetical protein